MLLETNPDDTQARPKKTVYPHALKTSKESSSPLGKSGKKQRKKHDKKRMPMPNNNAPLSGFPNIVFSGFDENPELSQQQQAPQPGDNQQFAILTDEELRQHEEEERERAADRAWFAQLVKGFKGQQSGADPSTYATRTITEKMGYLRDPNEGVVAALVETMDDSGDPVVSEKQTQQQRKPNPSLNMENWVEFTEEMEKQSSWQADLPADAPYLRGGGCIVPQDTEESREKQAREEREAMCVAMQDKTTTDELTERMKALSVQVHATPRVIQELRDYLLGMELKVSELTQAWVDKYLSQNEECATHDELLVILQECCQH